MKPDSVVQALQNAKVHPRLVAAFVAESVDLQCWPDFAGIRIEQPIIFNKCARQGGGESSHMWNAVMFLCLSVLEPLWLDSGYGVNLGGRCCTHCVWADNI